jgi:hypothetical protein
MWTQIVGKVRLVQTPWTNHSWHVPLYVTARGLGTSLIPYDGRAFEIDFDLLGRALVIRVADGAQRSVPLQARLVADFHRELFEALAELGLDIRIRTKPCEVADAIPFEKDTEHHHYDREFATRFWRALVQIDRVFKEFRSRFIGKCSPVHFFSGSFDLAVTRFSGREAPPLLLPYDEVRTAASPDDVLLAFLQSTYEAAAATAGWSRAALERELVPREEPAHHREVLAVPLPDRERETLERLLRRRD